MVTSVTELVSETLRKQFMLGKYFAKTFKMRHLSQYFASCWIIDYDLKENNDKNSVITLRQNSKQN